MNVEELVRNCTVRSSAGWLYFKKDLFKRYAKDLVCSNCGTNNFNVYGNKIVQYDCANGCNFSVVWMKRIEIFSNGVSIQPKEENEMSKKIREMINAIKVENHGEEL